LEHLLGIALSNVSYHMRQLEKFGLVEGIKSERVRGAVKTTFRATARMHLTQEQWSKLDKATRRGISGAAVAETLDRASRAIDAGTFDARLDRHVVNLHLDLDEDGWLEVSHIVLDAQERIERVEQQVANRTPDPEKRFRATATLLSYESPPNTH
jgi:DNA-binding transcriptional regulator GbsR (MarR family)